MLTFNPDDQNGPRKILSMVLMMAARDRASAVRLEPLYRGSVRMWYCVDGEWYEMVPTPQRFWVGMKQIVKEATSLHPLYNPPLSNLWWRRKPVLAWLGGVLDHRFGEQTNRWAVILDERAGREVLTLTGVGPASFPGDAELLLKQVSGRYHPQPELTT